MSICFIKIETNGLHKTNDNVSQKNIHNFARLVSISYLISDIDKKNKKFVDRIKKNIIIKPLKYTLNDSTKYHGITIEEANNGIEMKEMLKELKENLVKIKGIITHNSDFVIKTIQSECLRENILIDFSKIPIIDLMNYKHSHSYPKLDFLTSTYLGDKYLSKPKSYQVFLIKKIFTHLYFI